MRDIGLWFSFAVFFWLWNQLNNDLIEWVEKYSNLYFLEVFLNYWYYFLLKCLIELTSEAVWVWIFSPNYNRHKILYVSVYNIVISYITLWSDHSNKSSIHLTPIWAFLYGTIFNYSIYSYFFTYYRSIEFSIFFSQFQ